ncbi:hypothetical protein [Methylobacterium frigidaeris]|nr:hypothetical protein [Methylobacterium frigidaeris]
MKKQAAANASQYSGEWQLPYWVHALEISAYAAGLQGDALVKDDQQGNC